MSAPLPHSQEAERAVLGAVFIAPRYLGPIAELLAVDDFMMPSHRDIFDALLAVDARGGRVDAILVMEEMRGRGSLARLDGGSGYLLALLNEVPTAENCMHYARIVKQKASLRQLIAACAEVMTGAGGDIGDFGEFMADADAKLAKPLRQQAGAAPDRLVDLTPLTLTEFETRAANQGKTIGIPTGFMKLDYLLSGFQKENVYYLAGATSSGKTAQACQWALGAARRGAVVLFVTLEMPSLQLVERFFASAAPMDNTKLRTGNLEYADWKRLTAAGQSLAALDVRVVGIRNIGDIERKARSLRTENPDRDLFMVLDYLQLARCPGIKGRELEVAEVSRRLKGLARDYKLPVLALSQLNRAAEEGKPKLANLRESGALEHDADAVIFIVRSPGATDAVLDVAKNRNGPLGEANVEYDGATYSLREPGRGNWSESSEPDEA